MLPDYNLPILVGGAAASLRDCFPTWRLAPDPKDVDFVGTLEALEYTQSILEADSVEESPISGRFWIFKNQELIEFDARDTNSRALLYALPDNETHVIRGVSAYVISCTTQYLIKKIWSMNEYNRLVHWKDMQFFETMADPNPSQEHLDFYDAHLAECQQLFNNGSQT